MTRPLKVFLSYSRQDAEFARKLTADLAAEQTFDVFLDVADLKPGERFVERIREEITSADLLLVLLSSESVKSRWVIQEAELAASKGEGRVIPVIIDEGAKHALPEFLKSIQWLDLSTPELYTVGLRSLSKMAVNNEAVRVEGSIKVQPENIRAGSDVSITMPHGPRMADIIDVDDFAAKVAEKLRQQGLLGGEDGKEHHSNRVPADTPSKLVFVVMSFEEDMDPIFDGIEAAAEAAGLEAKRVKDVVGDYKIDSELIAMIREACMVVVDLTHERPNVYFELGYARGVGKTVITTARAGTRLHFDVQSWTCDFYSDSRILEKRLKERFKLEWARLAAKVAAPSPT